MCTIFFKHFTKCDHNKWPNLNGFEFSIRNAITRFERAYCCHFKCWTDRKINATIVNHFELCLILLRSNGKSEYNCDCLYVISWLFHAKTNMKWCCCLRSKSEMKVTACDWEYEKKRKSIIATLIHIRTHIPDVDKPKQ